MSLESCYKFLLTVGVYICVLHSRCIRGHLRSKPVILVTHQLQYLVAADRILVLKEVRKQETNKNNIQIISKYRKSISRSSYIDILNCALQHHLHIIALALAELPVGAHKHYKE